jgi:chemotaxis response regulator CheB
LAHHKQILVLEDKKLAAASILSLLISRPELDVINTTFSSLAYLDLSEDLQPDVVILEEELLAANISAVVKLADRHPKLRLIVFSLSDNTLNVFDKQRVQVRQVSDFLELL